MSFAKKVKKNIEKKELLIATGKTPKYKCPKCGKMSLWVKDKFNKLICIRCGK